jgi:arsenite methyltransferase
MTSSTYDVVNNHYSNLARKTKDEHADNSRKVALSFGYSADELSSIPESANLGVSCGNPLSLASLKEVSIQLYY